MDRVETELVKVIHARLHATPELSSRITDLNLDSIKTADFLRELEDEFDETVADLAAYIRARRAESSEPI